MLTKKISAASFLGLLAALLLACLVRGWYLGIPFDAGEGGFVEKMEQYLVRSMPLSRPLDSVRVNLSYRLGTREQDGVFIGEHRLIENIGPPVNRYVQRNSDAIIDFAKRQSVPVYMALIPTASAVLQSETPHLADSNIYNQKQFIEERYKIFSNKLSCVDVYSTLRDNSDKYIYYNTESLLTMQGGFFVYDVLTRRMGNTPYSLDRFNVRFLADNYYGSLYDRVEFRNINPDVLSLYTYSGTPREFSVAHYGGERRDYNTLYPTHLADLGRPLDVYFGGVSPIVEIVQKQSAKGKLLVFGDGQMRSILPFMVYGYRQITFVDLSQTTPQQLSELPYDSYNEMLFAYSVDTFMHSDAPSRMGLY